MIHCSVFRHNKERLAGFVQRSLARCPLIAVLSVLYPGPREASSYRTQNSTEPILVVAWVAKITSINFLKLLNVIASRPRPAFPAEHTPVLTRPSLFPVFRPQSKGSDTVANSLSCQIADEGSRLVA